MKDTHGVLLFFYIKLMYKRLNPYCNERYSWRIYSINNK